MIKKNNATINIFISFVDYPLALDGETATNCRNWKILVESLEQSGLLMAPTYALLMPLTGTMITITARVILPCNCR